MITRAIIELRWQERLVLHLIGLGHNPDQALCGKRLARLAMRRLKRRGEL